MHFNQVKNMDIKSFLLVILIIAIYNGSGSVIHHQQNNTMKKLKYVISVNANAEKVYKIMLGINNVKDYEQWTSAFNPTSTYEGKWDKDSKIYFVGTGEDGKRGGMVSEIAENIPNKVVNLNS